MFSKHLNETGSIFEDAIIFFKFLNFYMRFTIYTLWRNE